MHEPINSSIIQVQEPINILYQSIASFYKCRNQSILLPINSSIIQVQEPINILYQSIASFYKCRNQSILLPINSSIIQVQEPINNPLCFYQCTNPSIAPFYKCRLGTIAPLFLLTQESIKFYQCEPIKMQELPHPIQTITQHTTHTHTCTHTIHKQPAPFVTL